MTAVGELRRPYGRERSEDRTGLSLPSLMPPCLPNAESQGLEGFEAFNPGIQERGKRKQSKECR